VKPYFVGHPGPSVLFACTVAVWIASEVRQALHRRPEASAADRGSLLVLRIWAAVAAVVAALAITHVPSAAIPVSGVAFGVGLALM
jgi:hypothetical protein